MVNLGGRRKSYEMNEKIMTATESLGTNNELMMIFIYLSDRNSIMHDGREVGEMDVILRQSEYFQTKIQAATLT